MKLTRKLLPPFALAGALALSPASPIAPAIGFVLLRAIIPGKRPVAPAWVLQRFPSRRDPPADGVGP